MRNKENKKKKKREETPPPPPALWIAVQCSVGFYGLGSSQPYNQPLKSPLSLFIAFALSPPLSCKPLEAPARRVPGGTANKATADGQQPERWHSAPELPADRFIPPGAGQPQVPLGSRFERKANTKAR